MFLKKHSVLILDVFRCCTESQSGWSWAARAKQSVSVYCHQRDFRCHCGITPQHMWLMTRTWRLTGFLGSPRTACPYDTSLTPPTCPCENLLLSILFCEYLKFFESLSILAISDLPGFYTFLWINVIPDKLNKINQMKRLEQCNEHKLPIYK